MGLVSFAEYARHRGVSRTTITEAVRSGRIPVQLENGKRKIDIEQADRAWAKNTRHDKRTSPTKSAPPESPVEPPSTDESNKLPSITSSRQIKEAYQARIAKIEYEEKMGKLVPADKMRERIFKHITAAKNKILGIHSKCKIECPELPPAAIAVIERICRETLEDIANGLD